MGLIAVFGRVLFCSIFIISALNKLQTVTHVDDPTLLHIEPKVAPIRIALSTLISSNAYASQMAEKVKFDAEEHLSSYNLNLVAIALELFGSLLFLTGSKHGARLLLIHMMAVTPIMHNFYAVMPGTYTTHA